MITELKKGKKYIVIMPQNVDNGIPNITKDKVVFNTLVEKLSHVELVWWISSKVQSCFQFIEVG